MKEKGFITRQEHKTDTRAKTIRLTTNGEIILQKAIIEVENADFDLFSALETKLPSFNRNIAQLIGKNKKVILTSP